MFYQQFIALCAERGITPTAAVEAMGMKGPNVTKWKRGAVPTDLTIYKIAQYFGVPVEYFTGETKKDQPADEDELVEVLQAARDDIRVRALFEEAAKAKPEDIEAVTNWLRRLREKS